MTTNMINELFLNASPKYQSIEYYSFYDKKNNHLDVFLDKANFSSVFLNQNKEYGIFLNDTMIISSKNAYEDTELKKYFTKLNFYIVGIGGMFLIGILTNFINLFILTRKRMKFKTTNRYLSALAICDLFVLFFSQITLSNSFFNNYSQSGDSYKTSSSNHHALDTTQIIIEQIENIIKPTVTQETTLSSSSLLSSEMLDESSSSLIVNIYYKWSLYVYPRIYPYMYTLDIMFQIGAVWLNLGMSMDRFIAIHFPLKSLKFCTIRNAKKIIVIIFLFSFFYSLPRYFEYHTKIEKFTINESETYEFVHNDLTNLGKSKLYRKIIYVWMYVCLQSVAPLILLSIINIALVISLRKSGQFLSRFNHNHTTQLKNYSITIQHLRLTTTKYSKRQDITIMLIFVVVLYVVLQAPAVFCNCIYGFNYSHIRNDSLHFNATICNIGNFFNKYIFFLKYFSFRRELLVFFRSFFNLISSKKQLKRKGCNMKRHINNSIESSEILNKQSNKQSHGTSRKFNFNKVNRVSHQEQMSNYTASATHKLIKYKKKKTLFNFKSRSNDYFKTSKTVYYTKRPQSEDVEMSNQTKLDGFFRMNKSSKKKYDFIDNYESHIVYL